MLTNFELKRLKPKLDIVEKPENRVHELTDSNGALCTRFSGFSTISSFGFNRDRLSSKLVNGRHVLWNSSNVTFVLNDFVRDCFIAQICAKMCVRTGGRGPVRIGEVLL